MTAITVAPIIINNCLLKLGTNNYEAHVAKATLTPNHTIVRRKGLTPTARFAVAADPEWTLELDTTQDYETVNSLSNYLLANQGTVVTGQLSPVAGGTAWDISVMALASAIGGDGDSVAASDVSLPVIGQPVKHTP